jgi:leucyl aminopeptidase
MGDGSSSGNSHSIFESILTNLKKIQENLSHEMHQWEDHQEEKVESLKAEKQVEQSKEKMLVMSDDNQTLDLKISMGLHRRLLDHEVDSINSELKNLLKNRESIDYLISLVEKRERLADQIHNLDNKIGKLEKEMESGAS